MHLRCRHRTKEKEELIVPTLKKRPASALQPPPRVIAGPSIHKNEEEEVEVCQTAGTRAASLVESVSLGGEALSPSAKPTALAQPPPKLLRHLAGHGLVARGGQIVPFPIRAVCVLPMADSLLTAGEDGSMKIWGAATGEMRKNIKVNRAGILSATLFKDGRRVLTTGADGVAFVWDIQSETIVSQLKDHGAPVIGGAVYPAGDQVITMGNDGSGRIWDVGGQQIAPLAGVSKTAVAIFPDGTTVAVASESGRTEIWRRRTGELVTDLDGHTGAVKAMAIFPDGTKLLTVGEDGKAFIWNADFGQQLRSLPPHGAGLVCAAVSACGSRVLMGGEDGLAVVADAEDGRILASWPADGRTAGDGDRTLYSCAFIAGGEQVVLAGAKGAFIWQLLEGARPVPPRRDEETFL